MSIKGLLYIILEYRSKVFCTLIRSYWHVDQRSFLLRSEIAQSQSWWKATKGLLNLGTWRKAIKGLLYFNLDLLKCRSKVFSTSIWTCWNVHQMSSLLRSGLVEMSNKCLLYFDLDLLKCQSKVFSDMDLLKCRSKVFFTSIWNCSISILMKGNQRAS